MSPLICLILFLVMTPLGLLMCRVTWPMAREDVGRAHRALGLTVCVAGVVLVGSGVLFLSMALNQTAT